MGDESNLFAEDIKVKAVLKNGCQITKVETLYPYEKIKDSINISIGDLYYTESRDIPIQIKLPLYWARYKTIEALEVSVDYIIPEEGEIESLGETLLIQSSSTENKEQQRNSTVTRQLERISNAKRMLHTYNSCHKTSSCSQQCILASWSTSLSKQRNNNFDVARPTIQTNLLRDSSSQIDTPGAPRPSKLLS